MGKDGMLEDRKVCRLATKRRASWFLIFCWWYCGLCAPQVAAAQVEPAANNLVFATSLTRSSLMVDIEQKLTRAYRQLGYQMTVEHLPSGRSLAMANDGLYDGELFRIADVENDFPNLVRIPVPLAQIKLHAFTRNTNTLPVDWTAQRKLRIGYVRGFRLASRIHFQGQAVPVTTTSQAVQMLLQDRIDVLLEDDITLRFVLGPNYPQVTMSPDVLAQADLFHFVHKKHQAIASDLAKALTADPAGDTP